MVQISYSHANGIEEIRFKGHANSAPKGMDIVCAAVSTLFYTLAENLEINAEWIDEYIIDDSSEEKVIYAKSEGGFSLDLHVYYDFIMNGLKALERDYPDFVKIIDFEVREKNKG